MSINKNLVLVSGAIVVKEQAGHSLWFIIKQSDNNKWEFPKVMVRKGESSVRAVLRIMGEKGGMSTRVLEEAGRTGGTTVLGGKSLPQRHIYYLMIAKSPLRESIGFSGYLWIESGKVAKKIASKRERVILKVAKDIYKKWKKDHPGRRNQI